MTPTPEQQDVDKRTRDLQDSIDRDVQPGNREEKGNMDNFVHYAKRLADYVRIAIEMGIIQPDSTIGIAYRDFMEEWRIYKGK